MKIPFPRRCACSLVLLALAQPSVAQPTGTGHTARPWARTLGGTGVETASGSDARNGHAYLCGMTDTSALGNLDAWVARLTDQGNALWQIALGGTGQEQFYDILATDDGGCIVAGYTGSFGAGQLDGWLVRLDAGGHIVWEKTYGDRGAEAFTSIARSPNGYYLGGATNWLESTQDAWVLEVDDAGEVIWQETLVAEGWDNLTSIAATPDGPVMVANSNSQLGGRGVAFFRPWVVALDHDGGPAWSKTYNYSEGDTWNHIAPVRGGGFVVTGEIIAAGFFRGDFWVARLDQTGNPVWDIRLGDNSQNLGPDVGWSVAQTADDGFLAAGSTETAGAGSQDMWLIKLSPDGVRQWDMTLGSNGFDDCRTMTITNAGNVLVAGWGQFPAASEFDALAVMLAPDGSTSRGCQLAGTGNPGQWTSALEIAPVSVNTAPTSVQPAESGATVVPIGGGAALCGWPAQRRARP